jgi:HSP20 family protein
VARDDISVELAGQELAISGEFRDSGSGTHGRALRRGRRSGRFEYRVLLPGHAEADKVTAALADGVLTRSPANRPRAGQARGCQPAGPPGRAAAAARRR